MHRAQEVGRRPGTDSREESKLGCLGAGGFSKQTGKTSGHAMGKDPALVSRIGGQGDANGVVSSPTRSRFFSNSRAELFFRERTPLRTTGGGVWGTQVVRDLIRVGSVGHS